MTEPDQGRWQATVPPDRGPEGSGRELSGPPPPGFDDGWALAGPPRGADPPRGAAAGSTNAAPDGVTTGWESRHPASSATADPAQLDRELQGQPGRTSVTPAPGHRGRASGPRPAARAPRRARLIVRRLDPWSVLKLALVLSVCLLIVFVVAVTVLFYVLDGVGVFASVTKTIHSLTSGSDTSRTDDIFTPTRIIGGAVLLGVINVVLVSALATVGAFVYNLSADLVGGVEVTLAERDA